MVPKVWFPGHLWTCYKLQLFRPQSRPTDRKFWAQVLALHVFTNLPGNSDAHSLWFGNHCTREREWEGVQKSLGRRCLLPWWLIREGKECCPQGVLPSRRLWLSRPEGSLLQCDRQPQSTLKGNGLVSKIRWRDNSPDTAPVQWTTEGTSQAPSLRRSRRPLFGIVSSAAVTEGKKLV